MINKWILALSTLIISIAIIGLITVVDFAGKNNRTNDFIETEPVTVTETETEKDIETESDTETDTEAETETETEKVTEANKIIETQIDYETYTEPAGPYLLAGQVEAGEAKDASYYDDALFIGDSRAIGFCSSMGIKNCYAKQSLGAVSMLKTSVRTTYIGEQEINYTILQLLANEKNNYTKVYFLLGVNDYYNEAEKWRTNITNDILKIKSALNEGTEVYFISIFPVNNAKAAEHGMGVTNAAVRKLNDILPEICNDTGIHLVNASEVLTDDHFYIPYSASTDGVHFGYNLNKTISDYILTHTVGSS